MFYIFFTVKIFIFYILPIFSISEKSHRNLILSISLQFLWIIYAAFLTYVPFYYYYHQNEVNIQHLIPEYFLLIIVFLFLILPIIYFISIRSIFSKLRIALNIIGVIFLIGSSIVIFGIDLFNYSKRVQLEKICYKNHSISNEMLNCCLDAEYIWNEGFSFLEDVPVECKIYMDWNE
tara:strand:+ start:2015 stop:2545 length:531 start_codon:yes stop_codon:yes gene_type:complete